MPPLTRYQYQTGANSILPLAQRHIDLVIVGFFILHYPITFLVDAQAVLPAGYFPQALRDMKDWYVEKFDDRLMGNPPHWFAVTVWLELIFQLPLFTYCLVGFIKGWNHIRLPTLLYAAHVVTILSIILPEAWPFSHGRPLLTRVGMISVYLPWVFFPLILIWRVWEEKPFTKKRWLVEGSEWASKAK